MTHDLNEHGQARPPPPEVSALERALREHRHELLAYLNRHVPNRMRRTISPDDVLQDTFFEAFRRSAQFQPDNPIAWLKTVARHCLINLITRQNRIKHGGGRTPVELGHGSSDAGDGLVKVLEELAVYERTPSQSAIGHELALVIERSIGRLPEHYQRAIRMRYMDRLAVAEIAVALGRTEGAVMQYCHRALDALREDLGSGSRFY